ncbi:CPBP family intramembrane metalloprotease [Clostridium niameyense]|uniref:CPBP family intramembrane metalloprotease n=1 Tax=Clostridium niameyense TaxID=1622073 RepID=A0A6M0RDD1_9CLOT|nr:type II CAAX endopeptidase family protein [Clostridium niameyense]NEZ47559.1 CPBP family intramembrane metalloprotease [Clostridium niameyense]
MNITNGIKNILVYLIVYLPPIILFLKLRNKKSNIFFKIIISILYIVLSIFTQNLLPFIFTVIDIIYLRKNYFEGNYFGENMFCNDYLHYKFNGDDFNLVKAIKYSIFSLFSSIIIMLIFQLLFSMLKLKLKQQEVVTWMYNMPLNKFLIVIPVAVIFAPLVEEFIFRWLIFEKIFKSRLGIILAAVFSSVLFGVIHYNLRAFPILIWMGIFNCYLIHKKGFWYSVFNHFMFNFTNISIMFLDKFMT